MDAYLDIDVANQMIAKILADIHLFNLPILKEIGSKIKPKKLNPWPFSPATHLEQIR